jgi:hypothetical protein
MKRFIKIASSSLIICLITFSSVAGQEKKTEQKIKIIVADGSGSKVLIDTLLKDSQITDSIKLKDGNVFYLSHSGEETSLKSHKGKGHYFVTVSDDGKENEKVTRDITIICSDSADLADNSKMEKVYVYTNSGEPGTKKDKKYKVTTKVSVDNTDKKGDKEEKVIYINKSGKYSEKSFDVIVNDDKDDSVTEKMEYVIAKDGMVITVKGNDEVKMKEIIKEIENKLGVNKEGSEKPETVKFKTKKAEKK